MKSGAVENGESSIHNKKGTCGHPALFTWHYTGYGRVNTCLYCKAAKAEEWRDYYRAKWLGEMAAPQPEPPKDEV